MKKKNLLITGLILTVMVLAQLSLLTSLPNFLEFPIVHATPTTYPVDGDAWTENDNATYPWTETYLCDLSFTSSDVEIGAYALNATHTSDQTKMYLYLTLSASIDVSGYDYLSFWLNASDAKFFSLYVYDVASGDSYYVGITPRTQWDLYVIRLETMSVLGSPSWASITKFWFKWSNDLTVSGNETFLIDGLHFGDYSQADATNNISEGLLPRFGFFMHNQSWGATGGYPESLYAWKRTDTDVQSNGLETEALGQSLYMYCWAYEFSGFDFYLDMAETWGNALYYMQNDTEGTQGFGGFGYSRGNAEQRMLVNAWIHASLAYLYHLTENSTYKTMLDNNVNWLYSMWNNTNNCFNHHYIPSTDTLTYGTSLDWGRDGTSAGAVSLYTEYVESNASLTTIADNVLNQMIDVNAYKLYSSVGLTETDTYGYWGLYNGYLATSNETYKQAFLNSSYRFLLVNLRNPNHNGSITANTDRYRYCPDINDGVLSGWGHMYGLLHLALAYDLTSNSLWSNLLSKMLWDYVYEAQTSDGSITFYRHAVGDYEAYNLKQYTPTSASVVASILWYYKNVAEPVTDSGAYILDGSEKLSGITHHHDDMQFTVTATSGKTSTTRLYCGSKGKPDLISGVDSWSYNTDSQVVTLTVTHSSDAVVTVSWGSSALGVYPLAVSVLQNGYPTLASVVIDGKNKTVFGVPVTFNLPYGNYFIIVYCGDQRQTKSIFLSGPQSVGFDFKVTESPNWEFLGWTLPLFIVVIVALYFFLRKKG